MINNTKDKSKINNNVQHLFYFPVSIFNRKKKESEI